MNAMLGGFAMGGFGFEKLSSSVEFTFTTM